MALSHQQRDSALDELNPPPDFIATKIELWDKLKARRDEFVSQQPNEKIIIKYIPGNGKPERKLPGHSWRTTPFNVARQVSIRSQLERWLVAKVDGIMWDLNRPLERSCTVELLSFADDEGKKVFWNSCTFVLAQASERRFGGVVVQKMIQDSGFACDWAMPMTSTTPSATVTKSDYKPLHRLCHRFVNQAHRFDRLEVSKPDLLQLFAYNKYKCQMIEQLPQDSTATVYRCGRYVDISEHPHLTNTGIMKAYELLSNSSCYFEGKAENDSLQRMQGIGYPTREALEAHKKWLEDAALRDHRRIGRNQELYFFESTVSPGSAFWLPHGQRIYHTLMSYIREEYWKRDYQEVTTPNMFNSALWKQSGHWQHYKDDMFKFEVEKDEWALKPMNCPGHCVLFGHRDRTFRELPLRISEFGILHRNEASGALSGLTRVRRFVQDDTHIFCMPSQVEEEVQNVLEWLTDFYHRICGFTFKVRLSTRPDDYLGDLETWNRAEDQLTKALNNLTTNTGMPWVLNPGDGAFYGPKIDIAVCDALNREFQCASIQLDFQLPEQFNLEYRTDQTVSKTENKIHDSGYATPTEDEPSGPNEAAVNMSIESTEPAISPPTTEESSVANEETDSSMPTESTDPTTAIPTIEQEDTKQKQKQLYRKPVSPGCARPVMIHRGIFGSFERFLAILCEHLSGKWPFWLSPRQVLVVPVTEKVFDYAKEVQMTLRSHGMHADVDLSKNAMTKKIRNGQLKEYNFVFVVGPAEKESRSVNIRNRDVKETHKRGEMIQLEKAVTVLQSIRQERQLSSAVSFT